MGDFSVRQLSDAGDGVHRGTRRFGFFRHPPVIAVVGALVIVAGAITTGRYWTWERITLALAIFNGLFIPAAILARPNWHSVGHALLTWMPLPSGSHYENSATDSGQRSAQP